MPVADFVLRNVRVVELGRGRGWVGPVDVFIEQGTVREIGHGLDHPAGIEEYDAQGRWAIPGLWDTHVHLAQWTARRDRLDLAGTVSPADALARVGDWLGTPSRPPGGPRPPHRALGRAADRRRPRRDRARRPGRPDRRRRPPRLAQLPRPRRARAARPRGRRGRERVVRGLHPDRHGRRARRVTRGLPPHPRPGRRPRDHRHRRPRARADRRRLGATGLTGARARRDVRRRPGRRDRRRSPQRRRAPRIPRDDHDGSAQDHLRRLAQHPDGLVLRGVRRRVRRRRAEPDQPRSSPRCSTWPTRTGWRSRPTRSATSPSTRRSRRTT